jgi:cytochrome c
VTAGARTAALAALALAAFCAACDGPSRAEREAAAMTGGDPRRGRALVGTYGCGTCHAVPGVPGATGTVGPPLAGIAARSFVAGRLENTPANLIRWLRAPREVDPATAMPDMGVTERDAKDLAAYLETLR